MIKRCIQRRGRRFERASVGFVVGVGLQSDERWLGRGEATARGIRVGVLRRVDAIQIDGDDIAAHLNSVLIPSQRLRSAESLERTVDRQNYAGRNIMTYIDGFVAAVPTANREKFKKHADEAAAIFKEYGALSVVESWGDDVPEGKITSFPMAVQRKDDETVVFSWIVWPSKEARKAAWDKMMADPRMKPEANPMPFDGKRMIYGGFEPIIER
jgi:uncharacterized protein YbaA (DUF1428 family)